MSRDLPIQLVPGRSVFLQPGDAAAEARFVASWGRVWRVFMPPKVCGALLRHWQATTSRLPLTPWIQICDGWPERAGDHAEAAGMCMEHGHLLLYQRQAVVALPWRFLDALVAHELVHVYQHARDFPGINREAHVDHTLAAWGLDGRGLRDWLGEHQDRLAAA